MNNIEFTQFINSMLGNITTQQVLNVLSGIIGIGMIFFLMWFGVRKITAQFTEMVAFGKWALTGKADAWDKYDDIVSAKESGMSVKDYKNWVKEEKTKKIGPSGIPIGKPIEPMEPHPERITPKQKKDAEEWFATHDSFGHELGYDRRKWDNYINKRNNYKKKYNNNKKYYYDSYGNKYYK